MSATVRLSAKMPGNEDTNGLDPLAGELVEDPSTIRVALVWYDVSKVTSDTDSHNVIPTVRIRRLEPLGTAAAATPALRKLAADAHKQRTGAEPLPFDTIDAEPREVD